jgi:SagB-type dehydrogenase family enzyme
MPSQQVLTLPDPRLEGDISVPTALHARRSIRDFRDEALTLEQVSQLLWAAQGVTAADGGRTAPSAGALYPLEFSLVAGAVEGLTHGIYRYRPRRHELRRTAEGDRRSALARAALRQDWMKAAPAILVVAAVYSRTTGKYGERGRKYVHMDVGHAAQNVYLQAAALDLGTTFVGAFHDIQVKQTLELPAAEHPLGLMPVGRPQRA